MAPKRGTRSAPRTRGPSPRSRGAIASQARSTGSSASNAGIRKPAPSTKKRPVQQRITKALLTTPTDAVDVVTQAEGAESQPAPNEPDSKVQRIIGDYMCSSWSLDFVYNFPITDEKGESVTKRLENKSEDTEIIALNLMDHFMQPENEVTELRYGILPAASFALACDLTKGSKDYEMIAEAVQVRVAMCSQMGVELPPEALELKGADVRKGCAVMLERRKELYPLVGGYAQELAHLARTVLGLEEVDEEFRQLFTTEGEARGEEGGSTGDNLDVSVDKLELTVEDEAAAVEDLMEVGMKNAEEEELIDFDVFDESEVDGV
ncbi:hypothetical protein KC318_g1059 [Hortaea werneckii]|nr:hypothetical protein KC334_g1468 [Hortaea werneckii]KAI7021056.1 hypothetical protein KC355_g2518 [Hortaea werneckii]KAI7675289.1 hypothetical protein KC318_g1059 [Hortaea werneckii]